MRHALSALCIALLLAASCADPSDDDDSAVGDDDDTTAADDDDATGDDDDSGDDDSAAASVEVEGPMGVVLSIDPKSLPAGVSIDDVVIEEIPGALTDMPEGFDAQLSPVISLQPAGIELTAEARMILPVGSWLKDQIGRDGLAGDAAEAAASGDLGALILTPGLWVVVPPQPASGIVGLRCAPA